MLSIISLFRIMSNEEANHQIVHGRRLGKADRTAHQPLDPRAQVNVLTLDLLRVCLPNRVLLCLHMPLIGSPAVSEIARDAKGLQERFEFSKDRVLPSPKHIGQYLARVVINGVP